MQSDFFKKGGAFAENVRSTLNDDLAELVASLKEHGWVPEFPALVDENGVVLVGHRRMKAAEIAGIKPVIKQLVLGAGDAADAERLRLAIVSNIGGKPLTKEDRRRIAQHLYGSREWTMERIAAALNVRQGTISKDLGNLFQRNNSNHHPKTTANPKGAGRPKGPRTTTAGESEVTRRVREYVRPLVERGEPLSVQEVAKAAGHSRIVSEAARCQRCDGIPKISCSRDLAASFKRGCELSALRCWFAFRILPTPTSDSPTARPTARLGAATRVMPQRLQKMQGFPIAA